MGLLGGLIGQLVVQLPMLAIVVVGGVLLLTRRDRLPRRSANFGLVGLGLLALSALADMVWYTSLPALVRSMGYSGYGLVWFVASLLLTLLHAAGIAMLVLGLISRAGPAAAAPGFGPAPGYGPPPGFGPAPGLSGVPGEAYPPPGSPYAPGYQPYPAPPSQPGPAAPPQQPETQQGWASPDQPHR
jgi:hypothetical protein